jgi:hypothetical protein
MALKSDPFCTCVVTECPFKILRALLPDPFGVTDPTLKFMRQKSHCKFSHSERFLDSPLGINLFMFV